MGVRAVRFASYLTLLVAAGIAAAYYYARRGCGARGRAEISAMSPQALVARVISDSLEPRRCTLTWRAGAETEAVGGIVEAVVSLYRISGLPFAATEGITITAAVDGPRPLVATVLPGPEAHQRIVQFSPRISGSYAVAVLVNNTAIKDSPCHRRLTAGPPDVAQCTLEPPMLTVKVRARASVGGFLFIYLARKRRFT